MPSFTPWTLPADILWEVVDILHVQDKIRLAAVNKEWRAFADQNPWFWYRLDFAGLRRLTFLDISSIVQPYISKINYETQRLTFSRRNTRCDWERLGLYRCQNLRELHLDCTGGIFVPATDLTYNLPALQKLYLCGDFDVTTPIGFLQNCFSLEQAHFEPDLRKLHMAYDSELVLCEIVSPKLKSLKFTQLSRARINLPSLAFQDPSVFEKFEIKTEYSTFTQSFKHYTGLKELYIPYCENLEHLQMPFSLRKLVVPLDRIKEASIVNSMPNLKVLGMIYHGWEEMNVVLSALKKVLGCIGDGLEGLSLTDARDRDTQRINSFCCPAIHWIESTGRAKNIRFFYLEYGEHVRKLMLDTVTRAFPKLQELYLMGHFTTFNNAALRASFEELSDLKRYGSRSAQQFETEFSEWLRHRNTDIKLDSEEILSHRFYVLK